MDNLQPQNPTEAPDTSMADSLRRAIAEERGEDPPEDNLEPAQNAEDGAPVAAEAEEAPEGEKAEAEEAAAEELAEVELDGKTFKVPAPLKDGYLRQADYTRKTMELATERQALQQARTVTEQAMQVMQGLGPVLAEFHDAKSKAEQFQKVDWNALYEQDPMLHNKLRLDAQDNLQKLQALGGTLQQAPQALQAMQAQSLAAEVARNAPLAKQWVPDYEQRREELIQVGRQYGYTDEELMSTPDARAIRALRDLAEYQKLAASRAQIRQQVASAPPVAKPGGKAATPQASAKEYQSAVRSLKTDSSDDAFVAALRTQRKLSR